LVDAFRHEGQEQRLAVRSCTQLNSCVSSRMPARTDARCGWMCSFRSLDYFVVSPSLKGSVKDVKVMKEVVRTQVPLLCF
jgi:hypothetical protein